MPHTINESIVEDAALTCFEELGYAIGHGSDIVASIVPFSRYLFATTETMEQYRHDFD